MIAGSGCLDGVIRSVSPFLTTPPTGLSKVVDISVREVFDLMYTMRFLKVVVTVGGTLLVHR